MIEKQKEANSVEGKEKEVYDVIGYQAEGKGGGDALERRWSQMMGRKGRRHVGLGWKTKKSKNRPAQRGKLSAGTSRHRLKM